MNLRTLLSISLILAIAPLAGQNTNGLSLDQLLIIGLDNSSSIRIAERNLKSAQASRRGSYSGLIPSLQTSITQDLDPQSFTGDGGSSFNPTDFSSSFGITQTLFDGAQSWYNAASGKNQVALGQTDLEQARQQAILEIKQAYYEYLSRRALLEVSEEALSLSQKQLELVEERFRLQAVRETDLLKAKVNAGQRKGEVLQSRQALGVAATQLNVALGQDPLFRINLADEEISLAALPDREATFRQLASENPRLKSQAFAVKGAWINAKRQRGVLLPTVRIGYSAGSFGANLDDVLGSGFLNDNSRTFLTISLPIFSGLRNSSSYSRSRYAAMAEEERMDGVERDLRRQLENTLTSLEVLHDIHPINQEVLASAEADVRLAEEQYKLGAISILDLLNAQVSLIMAKSSLVRTIHDIKIAEARLEALTGTNLQ